MITEKVKMPWLGSVTKVDRLINSSSPHNIKKYDSNKLQASCLLQFSNALASIVEVGMYGNKKYGSDSNWKKLKGGQERYLDALIRHLLSLKVKDSKFEEKNAFDEESKLLHLAHLAWNSLACLELALEKK